MTRRIHFAVLLAASALLGACATTYSNPNLKDAAQSKAQLAIDEGYCTQVAAGAAPIPAIRNYASDQQNYTVSGNISTFNPATGNTTRSTYTGTVNSAPSYGQGFASGFQSGASIGAAINAQNQQKAIKNGCMVRLGWTSE